MNAALRKSHTLKLSQILANFHVEGILVNEASSDCPFSDKGEDFSGTRVDMWCVQAARGEEEARESGAQACEGWESGSVGKTELAT